MILKNEGLQGFRKNMLFYLSHALGRPLVAPEYFMISLTDKCNLRCKMCGCWQTAGHFEGKELGTSEIKNIISEIKSWAKDAEVVFSGGEPFLRSDISELIDYVCCSGMKLSINTNGVLIDEAMADKLSYHPVHSIAFSLDADVPDVNDFIRGKGVFKKVLESIFLINEAKKRYRHIGPYLTFNVTIMKANINNLYNLVPLANQYGVQSIFFQTVAADNTDLQKDGQFFLERREQDALIEILEQIKAQANEYNIQVQVPSHSFLKAYFTKKQHGIFRKRWRCFAGYNRMSISSFGHIYSCNEKFGEIGKGDLRKSWYSRKAKDLRKQFKICEKLCLQTCYSRPASESFREVLLSLCSC